MPPSKLLIVSSRARKANAAVGSLMPGIALIRYSYESTSVEDLYQLIYEEIQQHKAKVDYLSFLLSGSEKELFLCEIGTKKVTLQTLVSDKSIRQLFDLISRNVLVPNTGRLDFFGSYAADHVDGGLIARELQTIMQIPVGIHRTLVGSDVVIDNNKVSLGSLFFDLETLNNIEENLLKVSKDKEQKLKNFEKLRTVGKGAFGAAILYRKKDDGLMVIIKEINMLDLSATERQMALNEVRVLATLDHPNIVTYYDSFERDGVLMIEMEYADGGNLAESLAKKTVRMEEKDIVNIFSQIVSAIRHMHDNNVLHRDLKTANIFLTKENMVKVGDFGISKMLSTHRGGAHTVLGTPYYISPEMCEGKVYDEKSDIWALGCILYEMAALQKTFEGSNLPALVNKIMKGQFAPIRGNYTPLFKQLVRDLLQRDPEFRPSAAEILLGKLPGLTVQYESHYYDDIEGMEEALVDRSKPKAGRPVRSIMYYLKAYESSISLTPVQLPPRSRIQQVAVSSTHIVVLTAEGLVFTWGEGKKGQLGHGELEPWRSKPLCVEALKGKSITRVGAGDGFSVFSSDNGIVMTCGDGSFGALGHGDWNSCARPTLIEGLLSVDVVDVGCGSEHVVVVGGRGDIYSWGRGQGGRLGLNSEEDQCSPREVQLKTDDIYITNVECGVDGTIFISHEGELYACGDNRNNRLGLNDQNGWIFSGEVKQALVPTKLKSIKHKIISVSLGPEHTACLTEAGHLVTFGRNSEAQLGRGHTRSGASGVMPGLVRAGGMGDRVVAVAECGASFTVCATVDNVLMFWGSRSISPVTRPSTQDAFGTNFVTRINTPEGARHDGDEETGHGHDNTEAALRRHQAGIMMRDIVIEPQEMLALYASEAQMDKGHTVMLNSVKCHNQNIFIVVETTCPLHRVQQQTQMPSGDAEQIIDMKDEDGDDLDNTVTSKEDNLDKSAVPDWLEAELKDAESDQKLARRRQKKKRKKKGGHGQPPGHPHSVTSEGEDLTGDQLERVRRLEKEYERRQQEIMLEAEAAVRAREEALNQELSRLREELERQRGRPGQESEERDRGHREDAGDNGPCAVM